MSKKIITIQNFKAGTGLCGTVLKDHPDVLRQSKKYMTLTSGDPVYQNFVLPKEFNGVERWQAILTYDYGQYGAADWAFIAKEAYLIRFNLAGYKNVYIPDLSQEDIIIRMNKAPIIPDPYVPSSMFVGQPYSIYQGYSLYDPFEYSYLYGFVQTYCYNRLTLEPIIDFDTLKTMQQKNKAIEDNEKLLGRSHCITKVNDKFIARRVFRTKGIANVGLGTDNSLQDDIIAIKSEIYHYGPVVAGFLAYDDYVNSYDGKTIYTGPKSGSRPVGGHSVCILGWGIDSVAGEYWILGNSWDLDWGLLGVYKMRIGIRECMLEKNVLTFMVDLPNAPMVYPQLSIGVADPELGRLREYVDPQTFMTPETISEIEAGNLVELSGKSIVSKLLENPKKLIDQKTFFAANLDLINYIQNIRDNTATQDTLTNFDYNLQYILLLSSIILLTFLGYKLFLLKEFQH